MAMDTNEAARRLCDISGGLFSLRGTDGLECIIHPALAIEQLRQTKDLNACWYEKVEGTVKYGGIYLWVYRPDGPLWTHEDLVKARAARELCDISGGLISLRGIDGLEFKVHPVVAFDHLCQTQKLNAKWNSKREGTITYSGVDIMAYRPDGSSWKSIDLDKTTEAIKMLLNNTGRLFGVFTRRSDYTVWFNWYSEPQLNELMERSGSGSYKDGIITVKVPGYHKAVYIPAMSN